MFSEKYGYKPEKAIQHERISDELRNRIWNLFSRQEIQQRGLISKRLTQEFTGEATIAERIADRMGFQIDPEDENLNADEQLKENILELFNWFEVYDFIDIYISFLSEPDRIERISEYNELLEQEKAGYRIVAGEVAPITNEGEIQTVEQAASTPYQSVNQHIKKALAFLCRY